MFLPNEYKSKKKKVFIEKEVREKIFFNSNNNLDFLLKKRFSWMRDFISEKRDQIIIELGSGSGCIKKVLNKENIILTDINKYDWINFKLDMLKINLDKKFKNNVDIFIINHALHHCPNPVKCLKLLSDYLKKDGLILINEPETSFSLKLIQMITKDEGWSYEENIFELKNNLFDEGDPWFSNTATGEMLFKNKSKFKKYFPEFEFIKNELTEFFIFLNSGGVNTNIFKIPLSFFFLNLLNVIDNFLIRFFPSIFALNRKIVLKKIKNSKY